MSRDSIYGVVQPKGTSFVASIAGVNSSGQCDGGLTIGDVELVVAGKDGVVGGQVCAVLVVHNRGVYCRRAFQPHHEAVAATKPPVAQLIFGLDQEPHLVSLATRIASCFYQLEKRLPWD